MIRILSILLLILGQTSGYEIQFTNVATADRTAVPIIDNNGDPIAQGSGFVAAGTFATLPSSVDEVRLFTPFGEGNTAFSNSMGVNGFFEGSLSSAIPFGTADAPVGESIYLVIGDGNDLASSTKFAVFDPGLVFGTDNAAGFGRAKIIIDSNSLTCDSLIYGQIFENVDTGLGLTFDKAIQIGKINTLGPPPLTLGYLSYRVENGKVIITDCDRFATGELVIPPTIEGNPVISIGHNAFRDCFRLTSITVPESVSNIGTRAFRCCSNLTTIAIPNAVTVIGNEAFRGCSSLTSITIPNGVTSISNFAFYDCSSLASIVIPSGVTSIGDFAFYGCTNLTNFTIPDGITSIGREAFGLVPKWEQRGRGIDGKTGDRNGNSVSLSSDGSVVAIGAYYNDDNGNRSGSVRIYSRNSDIWEQRGDNINGEQSGDESGYSVSLSSDGSVVAIGARYNKGNGEQAGHVRIYYWNGNKWLQRGNDIDSEDSYDYSGWSVSLSSDGSVVAIGAKSNDGRTGGSSGHVRIYRWSGNGWLQRGRDIDGEAAGDQSGWSVSLSSDGSVVAIGAPFNDGNGDRSGHVRIYSWNGNQWIQRGGDIDAETDVNGKDGDRSGWSVSLSSDGSVVAIGAPWNDGNGYLSGHVRIYRWNGSAWEQRGQDIDGKGRDNRSGTSVSLSADGSVVAIGSPDPFSGTGHVRIYYWNGVVWAKLGDDINGEDFLSESGYSVSLSSKGSVVAIGSKGGAVNIYEHPTLKSLPQEINFPLLGEISFAQLQKELNATSTSALPVSYTSSNPSLASVTQNGQLKINSVGLVTITAYQNGDFSYERAAPVSRELVVVNDLAISSQPSSQKVPRLGEAAFSVRGESRTSVTYQWRKNGVDIDGAISAALRLQQITVDDEASYSCLVSNSYGSIESAEVTLTLIGQQQVVETTGEVDANLSYSITDDEVTIIDCNSSASGELIIPNSIEGNPVTSIGIDAFADCISLTSITIPDSVTSIEIRAFDRCVNLTSVTIPESITRITNGAFRDCTSLPSITIPESVTSIGIRAFYNCTSLASITIPESLTSIEDNAFGFCSKLTSVTIPESVTLIGRGAFIRCSSLINISVDGGNLNYSSIDGVLFTKAQGTLLFFPSGREGLYSIPEGVTSINSFAFDSCLLSEVIIPDGVTSIGLKAFQYSSQLTSIIIPEGVTSIEPETFRESSNLASVALPSSLTTIGAEAFSLCSNLMEVVLAGPAPVVQLDAFASIADAAKALPGVEYIESYGGEGASWEGLTIGTNGSEFRVVEGKYTWQEARDDAEARGGRLAVLNTQTKNQQISSLLQSYEGSLWIGLTDEESEGNWKWITGENTTNFSNWADGQPDNAGGRGEDYAHIFWRSRDQDRRWNDVPADDRNVGPGFGNFNNLKGYLLEIYPRQLSFPIIKLDSLYESLEGETIIIDATPSGGWPSDFTYQWFFNDTLIPAEEGGTASTITLTGNNDQNGIWKVKVTNQEGITEVSFNYHVRPNIDFDFILLSDETRRFFRVNKNLSFPLAVSEVVQVGNLRSLAVTENGHLYSLNKSTNSIVTIDKKDGSIINTVGLDQNEWDTGLAFDLSRSRLLYGIASDMQLRTINPQTGETNFIANITGAATVNAISFSPDGELYAVGSFEENISSTSLFSLSPTTGTLTEIGVLQDTIINEITFSPDGFLYGINTQDEDLSTLYRINATTAMTTIIGSTGVKKVTGLISTQDFINQEEQFLTSSKFHFNKEQGYFGWFHGYYSTILSPSGFNELPAFENDFWVIDATNPSPRYWTRIGQENVHPQDFITSGGRTPALHWAVRRWESWVEGSIKLRVAITDANTAPQYNGQRIHIYHGNEKIDEITVGTDFGYTSIERQLNLSIGDKIDIAIDPLGDDRSDGLYVTASISLIGETAKRYPQLNLINEGNGMLLRWPRASSNYTLYTSLDLKSPWTPVPTGFTETGSWRNLRFSPDDQRRFFKLEKNDL